MKTLFAVAALSVSLIGALGPASAQYYGRPYEERGPDYGYGDRGPRYRDRDVYEERGPRYRDRDFYEERGARGGRDFGFNEREYLRCNPDVLAAVRRGQMPSGMAHYQTYGIREHRRLRC